MCVEVKVGGTWCMTIGEFRGQVGELVRRPPDDMQRYDENEFWADDQCLCHIDVEQTAEKHGYSVRVDETDSFIKYLSKGATP